jgi:low affinity Fe/Cu permease
LDDQFDYESTVAEMTSFRALARAASLATGRPATFVMAAGIILAWGLTGPLFDYSDTWQLVINTGTTIVTFLMVFLIQNTQNRDTQALQLKLDELIRATKGAKNALIDLEDLEDEVLEETHARYCAMADAARHALKNRKRRPRRRT